MPARRRRRGGFRGVDGGDGELRRYQAAGARRAGDGMLDERQHRRGASRDRLRASLQSLPAHEAHHAAQNPPRARNHAPRRADRPRHRRRRAPRHRAHAGGVSMRDPAPSPSQRCALGSLPLPQGERATRAMLPLSPCGRGLGWGGWFMTLSAERLAGQPIIVGAGLAGLMTALHLAPQPVVVLTKASLGAEAASGWAQGGIAAALGADDDSALHAADTIASGDGLSDPETVERITRAGARVVEELARRGVVFDRSEAGDLALGLEAAHSRRRIVHAGGGDGAGRAIMRALVAAARRTPSITILEHTEARRLLVADGRVAGVLAVGPDPMPLVSEAVRGEGAVLIDETGARFMAGHGRAELEPRDVVARAVWRHLAQGHRVFLDARAALGPRFAGHFPVIAAACRSAGIDPALEPIPVRPAAHYLMGGIAVDAAGRSSVAGLWACGEAASTGLHGANRLASNSLLEAAASARWVAESLAATSAGRVRALWPVAVPPAVDATPVRDILSAHVGVLRDGGGLAEAVAALGSLAGGNGPAADPACVGLLIAVAALRRQESRGSHCRSDFPAHAPHRAQRKVLRLAEAEAVARELLAAPLPRSLRA